MAAVPEFCPAPRGGFDLELVKALLGVLVVPMMITPIVDPVVYSVVSPAAYPEPPLRLLFVRLWPLCRNFALRPGAALI